MVDEKKKIPSYTIDIIQEGIDEHGRVKGKLIISEEKDSIPWHREKFDRKKDGLLVPEIMEDMNRISLNLCKINEKGERIGKYPAWMTNLSPNPKTSKGAKQEYSSYLKEGINKGNKDNELAKFIGREKLVYIIVYLRDKRYLSGNDVDNFAKLILDSLKPFIGDDDKITTLMVEKKLLSNYPKEDLDFIEQAVVVVTVPDAKKDLFK